MDRPRRVAYTLEQCWHRVPGGTAVAALETLRELETVDPGLELVGVAGHHDAPPVAPWDPGRPVAGLSGHGARLYASWLWLGRPAVERATGRVDVTHATTLIPPPTAAPLVVTIHDLAFRHEPAHFTRWGHAVFERSLAVTRRRATAVLCSSQATADDCVAAGIGADRIRLVPLGVRPAPAPGPDDLARVRRRHDLPDAFVLFVGTLEPRKNLAATAAAVARSGLGLPLVVAGPSGWGELELADPPGDVRFVGFVASEDLSALYAAATVFVYPSRREGFGLPVLEAMAAGAPVVTSRGTATEEAAGGAAVLVDPGSIDDIAGGIAAAAADADRLRAAGLRRAAEMSWSATARLTAAAYREVA